jgi:hypothetical protein
MWEEIVALGVPRLSPGARIRALEEAMMIVRALSGGGLHTFSDVIERDENDRHGQARWRRLCRRCGSTATVRSHDLRHGRIRSCRCWANELSAERLNARHDARRQADELAS